MLARLRSSLQGLGDDLGRDHPQILSDNGQLAQGALQCLEQLFSWSLDPAPDDGSRFRRRYLPIGLKASKVVDPQNIHH